MILLVEDSPDDVMICTQVLQKIVANRIMTVTDGKKAIDYLDGVGEYRDRQKYPLPQVLMLDLKLPYMDGFAVLEWLKDRPDLKVLVVVLSHYGQTKDINRAYSLGAHTFLAKPLKHEDVVYLTNHFKGYWQAHP